MITALLIAVVGLTTIGLGVLWFCLCSAELGYETETGFHQGVEPKPVVASVPVRESVAA